MSNPKVTYLAKSVEAHSGISHPYVATTAASMVGGKTNTSSLNTNTTYPSKR